MKRFTHSLQHIVRARVSHLVLTLGLFYVPFVMILRLPFRPRDYFGGTKSGWTLSSIQAWDYRAFSAASLETAILCVPVLTIVVLLATALASFLRVAMKPGAQAAYTGALFGLVASEGILKALVYREVSGLIPSGLTFVTLSAAMLLPLATLSLVLGFRQTNPDIVRAAKDLGASLPTIIRHVLIPMNGRQIRATTWLSGVVLLFNLVYADVFLGGQRFLIATLLRHQYLENADWPSAGLTMLGGGCVFVLCTYSTWVITAWFLSIRVHA